MSEERRFDFGPGGEAWGVLLDTAALLPSAEELADRVLEIAEDVTPEEALKIGVMCRRTVLELLEEGLRHPGGEIGRAIEEGDDEVIGRVLEAALERRLGREGELDE